MSPDLVLGLGIGLGVGRLACALMIEERLMRTCLDEEERLDDGWVVVVGLDELGCRVGWHRLLGVLSLGYGFASLLLLARSETMSVNKIASRGLQHTFNLAKAGFHSLHFSLLGPASL